MQELLITAMKKPPLPDTLGTAVVVSVPEPPSMYLQKILGATNNLLGTFCLVLGHQDPRRELIPVLSLRTARGREHHIIHSTNTYPAPGGRTTRASSTLPEQQLKQQIPSILAHGASSSLLASRTLNLTSVFLRTMVPEKTPQICRNRKNSRTICGDISRLWILALQNETCNSKGL